MPSGVPVPGGGAPWHTGRARRETEGVEQGLGGDGAGEAARRHRTGHREHRVLQAGAAREVSPASKASGREAGEACGPWESWVPVPTRGR
ncbi:hypothetical protein SUDANB70_04839 [Streptomyces sp. enrichment culture]